MAKQRPKKKSKYSDQSKQGKDVNLKVSSNQYSFLISLENSHDKIPIFIDSLSNIKANHNNFEFILSDNSVNADLMNELGKNENVKELLDNNSLKIVSEIPKPGFNEFIKEALHHVSNESIIILDINNLGNPDFLNDIVSNLGIKQKKDKCIAVQFNQNQRKINTRKSNFFIIPLEISKYLFNSYSFSKSSFNQELIYYCEKNKISIEKFSVSKPGKNYKENFNRSNFFQSFITTISLFLNWFIKVPIKELKHKSPLYDKHQKESSIFRLLFVIISVLIFTIIPILSYQAGNSGDEPTVYEQAEKSYNYYKTWGKDKSAIESESKDSRHSYGMMQYYGGTFDLLTYTVNTIFNVDKEYETRHLLNGLTGCFIILFASLIVGLVAGWRAGVIALIFMLISPRLLGHSFNNPKDIPFAMGYTMAIFYFLKLLKELPSPKKSTFIGAILGIAITVSLRIGGLILIPYLILFVGLWFLFNLPSKKLFNNQNYDLGKKLAIYVVIISIFGYFIGLIFWPFGIENPLTNPIEALGIMTKFPVSLRQLFEGKLMWSDQLPWYYALKYMIIGIPIIILLGFLLFAIFIFKKNKNISKLYLILISFSCVFPIFWIIYKESNLYGGMRHIMFAFIFFIIISVLGFELLIQILRKSKKAYIVYILMLVLSINPIRHIIANHPYEYVYFNEIQKGIKGAYGEYELDYYFHSVKEATEWITDQIDFDKYSADNKLIIATNYGKSEKYYLRKYMEKIKVVYLRYYDRGNFDWDYAIIVNTYIDPYQLKNDIWPPSNTVYTIDVDGKPICAIIKREDKSDFAAFEELKKNNSANAMELYHKSIAADPTNELAHRYLINLYLNQSNFDSVISIGNKVLSFYPDYDDALYYQGIAYLNKNNPQKAQENFNRITRSNYKSPYGYHGLALMNYHIYKNPNAALEVLRKGMEVTNPYKPHYLLLAEIYRSQGNEAMAKQVMDYANKMR